MKNVKVSEEAFEYLEALGYHVSEDNNTVWVKHIQNEANEDIRIGISEVTQEVVAIKFGTVPGQFEVLDIEEEWIEDLMDEDLLEDIEE